MNSVTRNNRNDQHKHERYIISDNCNQYTTSFILAKLFEEREINCMVSKKLLDETDHWISKFRTFPEVVFNLDVVEYFVEFFMKNQNLIEATVYPKKRRGPPLLPNERLRSKRISVYISDAELEILENSAKSENMSISSLLREIGLNRKKQQKPAKLDLQAYSELSRAAANLNQISKHLNSHPEAIHELESIKSALNDFRLSLIGAKDVDGQ